MKQNWILRLSLLTVIVLITSALVAQEAKIQVTVYPPEAQIFLDAKTVGKGPAKLITTTPGSHMLIIANYGFSSITHEVSLNEGENPALNFTLQRLGGPVSTAWGRIQIENAPGQAGVFLNGKTPGYLVGHVDMFNNNNLWYQGLIVPAGTHHVTVAMGDTEFWSGDVQVPANKRVIIDAGKGTMVTKDWAQGAKLSPQPRFTAGSSSASVVVAPVIAAHAAEPARINCGETTKLTWTSQDAVDTTITANSKNMSDVPVSGQRTEQPLQTTTYQFQTSGPGGVISSSKTTEVNTLVTANMDATPADVKYHRMGDKVVEQTAANLNWTSSNSDAASIDTLGTVATKGDQQIKPVPKQNGNGPVDEHMVYTLTAKNMCGGSETKTATVHITGMIEPVPTVPLASVFFPTGYPEANHPQIGLVKSQHDTLAKTAEGMKKYLIYDPDAKITLIGHTDVRGTTKSNESLSQRRADRVKTCLVKQGVPADKIEIVAQGEKENLTSADVARLHKQNPNKPAFAKGNSQALDWAYNRRVDITLLPTGQQSTQFFPGHVGEAELLFKSEFPSRRLVEKAGEGTTAESIGSGAH